MLSVSELSQKTGHHPAMIAKGLINLLNKGLVKPQTGTVEEAIADLEQQITSGQWK